MKQNKSHQTTKDYKRGNQPSTSRPDLKPQALPTHDSNGVMIFQQGYMIRNKPPIKRLLKESQMK